MLPPPPTSTLFPYTRSSDLSSGGRQPGLSNQGPPWLEPSFPARPHGLAHRIRRDRRNHGPRGPQRHLGLAREARYSLTNRLAPGRLHFASDGAGSLLSHPVSAVNSEIASACYHGSEKKTAPMPQTFHLALLIHAHQ